MPTKTKFKTREQWMNAAAKKLHAALFRPHKLTAPKPIRFSCGFPRGCSKAIGQAWDDSVSGDGTREIFISPVLADPVSSQGVLPTMAHEMIHAYVGNQHHHGKEFRRVAKLLGLEGKMTATFVSEGTPLHKKLAKIASELGPYPHGAIVLRSSPGRTSPEGKKNITFRSISPEFNGMRVAMKAACYKQFGPPLDPEGLEMVEVNGRED